ncbi:MAG: hypothetical protein H7Z74_17370 [Anaerolineae bacterium]|nr:hypothetical protein [Gemmatimonadaceae bacterium]
MTKLLAAFTALAISAAAPAVNAQFTATVIPPKKPKPEVTVAAVTTVAAAKDTTLSEKLTDMKAWVDSAAVALAAKPPTAATDSTPSTDSVVVAREPTEKAHASSTARFKSGSPAPDTATPIPMLLLAGAAMLAAGRWIRRR